MQPPLHIAQCWAWGLQVCSMPHWANILLLLIMPTSLAPSPMAKVTAFLCFFTSSTTWAFWSGVTRQHTTVLHMQASSRRSFLTSLSRAWAYVIKKKKSRIEQETINKRHYFRSWFLVSQLISFLNSLIHFNKSLLIQSHTSNNDQLKK